MKRAAIWFLVLAVGYSGALASASSSNRPRLKAVRVPQAAIHVDGRIEPIWWTIPAADSFLQQKPLEGQPATERTTVRVAYDDRLLYVLIRAYDSEPEKIVGRLVRRDVETPSDWVGISFDSYHDHNTAYAFGVNAAGSRMDMHIWNNGEQMDTNWDAVWYVKTTVDDSGWIAEFGIPFSQLRYPHKPVQTWGFNAMRFIYRKNEEDHWSLIPRDALGEIIYYGELEGLENLPQVHGLELLPYSRGSLTLKPKEPGNPFRSGPGFSGAVGLDARYAVSSDISLNLTVNPDFGQVEADPSEFNLTAYETFFEEKRPFFLEGANIFSYPIGVGDGEMGNATLFYSRRIGRSPQVYPNVPDSAYVKMPEAVNILGAAKLSGRTKNGWSLGVLEALTEQAEAEIQEGNRRYRVPVEPRTNYFVARVRKEMRQGRTALGGILTHVARDLSYKDFDVLNRRAVTGGLDLDHRWHNDNWMITASLFGSRIEGSPEAIQRAQKSSARYFQRPDAPHVHYDPTRTSLSGFGGKLFAGKFGGSVTFGVGGLARSPGFESNDIGYMRMTDFLIGFLFGGYRHYKPGRVFRMYRVNLNFWDVYTFGREHLLRGWNVNVNFQLLNYWGFFAGVNRDFDRLEPTALRGGPALRIPDRTNTWFGFYSDNRKPIRLSSHLFLSWQPNGTWNRSFSPEVTADLSGRLNVSVGPYYSVSRDKLQYVATVEDDEGTPHYVLAQLDRKTLAITTRFSYTLTPHLSLQFYGMPFVTAGRYSDFKEVISPKAPRYGDRFAPYEWDSAPDFNFKQFRSNLVLRWEYRPGSALYLVWSQGRTRFDPEGVFDAPHDLRRLFTTAGDHVLLVKLTYWFSV
ncbi:MAG: carbohydrate binding family 9 domain-containing protein [Calditrichaeota bacterium]|nr:carbohydrate binding family 9 domain-containing protein [Calditrichota bacterium]